MDGNGAVGATPRPAGRRRATGRDARAPAHRRGGDRPRRRVARGLRVLDRELDAAAGRGAGADGDLRRDDRAASCPTSPRRVCATRFIGRRDRAPDELQEQMAELEEETAGNDAAHLWIAFDYGGRAELVDAARRLVEAGVTRDDVDEERSRPTSTRRRCPTRTSLIRTSGELRISNFLLWQLAYAELVFVDRSGPTSTRPELRDALDGVRGPPAAVRRPMSTRSSRGCWSRSSGCRSCSASRGWAAGGSWSSRRSAE